MVIIDCVFVIVLGFFGYWLLFSRDIMMLRVLGYIVMLFLFFFKLMFVLCVSGCGVGGNGLVLWNVLFKGWMLFILRGIFFKFFICFVKRFNVWSKFVGEVFFFELVILFRGLLNIFEFYFILLMFVRLSFSVCLVIIVGMWCWFVGGIKFYIIDL